MKNYVVTDCFEEFKYLYGVYKYRGLGDGEHDNVYFETIEEAKKYIDNCKLKYEFTNYNHTLYLEYLELYKYNSVDDEIDFDGGNLYGRGFDIDKLMKENNVKIEY